MYRGSLLRSCVAFGIKQVIVVSPKNSKLKTFGNQNTLNRLVFIYFNKLIDAIEYIKQQQFNIVGLEISNNSIDVTQCVYEIGQYNNSGVFYNKTVLVPGNEANGLTEHVKQYCNRFIYIPQYTTGTASLNVAIAGSIVMQYFALWAQYKKANIIGQKYKNNDNVDVDANNNVSD